VCIRVIRGNNAVAVAVTIYGVLSV
jgi:hypothetical protein